MAGFRQLVGARGVWGCDEAAVLEPAPLFRPAPFGPRAVQKLQPAKLARAIEAEVIPRLMLAHRAPVGSAFDAALHAEPDAAEVADFAELVLEQDLAVLLAFVEAVRARGASLETVFLRLLAPTARLLGDLWKEDLCTFTDVTVGLSRLQQVLRALSAPFEELEPLGAGHRALLAPAPGEQHGFGLLMVEEFFRRAGWAVTGAPRSAGELLDLVRRDWFDLVGFSASCDAMAEKLSDVIKAVRQASRNRGVAVLVGGRLFNERPELVARVGADGTAIDGRQAVLQVPRLGGLAARRC